ncbi:phage major capsid protein [Hoeflea alexandrii]
MSQVKELRAEQSRIAEAARQKYEQVSDNTPKARVIEIEREFDAMMAEYDAIGAAITRLERFESIAKDIDKPDPRRPGGNVTFRSDGANGVDLIDVDAAGLTREMRMADHVRELDVPTYEGLTPGAYLRAMFNGAKSDAERRALSEGTNSAGGFTVPDILSSQFIDAARKAATVFQAGAITVPLSSDSNAIAKVSTDPVPAWRAENAAIAESDPTFAQVIFTPRSLAVLVKCSRELLMDSLNMETLLPQVMASAMAVELDRVALFGTGSAPQPKGVVNFSGVQEVAHDAALASYAPLISARTLVKTANHAGVTAYIMHPRDEGVLAGLTATDDQPLLMPPAIANVPMFASTSVPANEGAGTNESTIVTGDFSKLMIGIRHQIQIEVMRELFAANGQIAFIAHLRADVAATHENAFSKITGIVPAS